MIEKKFDSVAEPITSVGISAPNFIIERFASYFPPNTPFAFILSRLREMGRVSERFQMCDVSVAIKIAEVIQEHVMSIEDRCIFLTAPVSTSSAEQLDVLWACAKCVADKKNGHLLDIEDIDLEILDVNRADGQIDNAEYLHRLESLHKSITLYLWLSYRYRGVFRSQQLAFHVKELVEEKITEYLEKLSYVSEEFEKRRKRARRLATKHMEQQEVAFGETEVEAQFPEEEPLAAGEVEESILSDIGPGLPGNKAKGDQARA